MNGRPLFDFVRPPILFIGSGISKRYLLDYKSWKEMLYSIAERIGIDKRRFASFIQSAEGDASEYGTLPKTATNLKQYLIENLMSGSIRAEDVYTPDELKMYDEEIDAFKILVASQFASYTIRDTLSVTTEMRLLRNLINIVPSIITTNFDRFLENEIFKEFKTYTSISDYYLSGSQGIGEIYKIHGSVESPDSLIICEKDYIDFNKNSKIVSAKMLSMLCDYPMVIIGYSMDDVNIKKIIYNLMSSLNDEKLREIEKNIYYVSYKEGESGLIKGKASFEYEEKRLTLSSIETDNFEVVFEELSSYLPSTSPSEIRKLRQLVKNIVLTSKPSGDQFLKIHIDDLDSSAPENVILMVSDVEYGHAIKEYTIITPDTIIEDILFGGIKLDPEIVLKHFNEYTQIFATTSYIPICPYVNRSKNDSSLRISKYIKVKEKQFENMLGRIEKTFTKRHIDEQDIYKDFNDSQRPLIVVFLFMNKKISYEDALELLKDDFNLYMASKGAMKQTLGLQ